VRGDWEQNYRDGVFPWDKGEPAPPLLQVLEEWPRDWWGEGPVLVPGCGRGHDVELLRREGMAAVGLDVSTSALGLARELYGDDGQWMVGDLFDAGLAAELKVGAVWEHTCFCAIDPERRPDYVLAMASLLPPGGRLIGVFYLDPGVEEGPPFGSTREEIEGLFEGLFERGREEIPHRCYPSREGREWLVEFIRKP
jgi:SAM-dependent methyltransferase